MNAIHARSQLRYWPTRRRYLSYRVEGHSIKCDRQLLPSPSRTLCLPSIRRWVIAIDELIREGLFGAPTSA
jgi:hypothetical protein